MDDFEIIEAASKAVSEETGLQNLWKLGYEQALHAYFSLMQKMGKRKKNILLNAILKGFQQSEVEIVTLSFWSYLQSNGLNLIAASQRTFTNTPYNMSIDNAELQIFLKNLELLLEISKQTLRSVGTFPTGADVRNVESTLQLMHESITSSMNMSAQILTFLKGESTTPHDDEPLDVDTFLMNVRRQGEDLSHDLLAVSHHIGQYRSSIHGIKNQLTKSYVRKDLYMEQSRHLANLSENHEHLSEFVVTGIITTMTHLSELFNFEYETENVEGNASFRFVINALDLMKFSLDKILREGFNFQRIPIELGAKITQETMEVIGNNPDEDAEKAGRVSQILRWGYYKVNDEGRPRVYYKSLVKVFVYRERVGE